MLIKKQLFCTSNWAGGEGGTGGGRVGVGTGGGGRDGVAACGLG